MLAPFSHRNFPISPTFLGYRSLSRRGCVVSGPWPELHCWCEPAAWRAKPSHTRSRKLFLAGTFRCRNNNGIRSVMAVVLSPFSLSRFSQIQQIVTTWRCRQEQLEFVHLQVHQRTIQMIHFCAACVNNDSSNSRKADDTQCLTAKTTIGSV